MLKLNDNIARFLSHVSPLMHVILVKLTKIYVYIYIFTKYNKTTVKYSYNIRIFVEMYQPMNSHQMDYRIVIPATHRAITTAPADLFPEFEELRPLLLARSPIAKNRPLFYALIDSLIHFKKTGTLPLPIPFPLFETDVTTQAVHDFLNTHRPLLRRIDLTNPGHIKFLLKEIGADGVHLLCGIRRTAGSDRSLYPPPTSQLMLAFNELHKGQALTVGGRAFSKHSIRDSAKFWGVCSGKNDYINEEAVRCVDRIVARAAWNNVFALPGEAKAYEVRERIGYGVRWEFKKEGIMFRGFVEPVMKDGHEKRWRH